jgi:branched-chain amino acid transport system permease protein
VSLRWPLVAVALLALAVGPRLLSNYYLAILTTVLIWAVFAMSLDLLVGYAGLPSLGHSAFFGLTAYGVAITGVRHLDSFWLEMAAGLLLTVLVAAVLAPLALRARGIYFLMITLALTQIAWGIALGWRSMTGGNDGIRGVPVPDLGLGLALGDPLAFYYLVLVVSALAAGAMHLVTRSPFGRALLGIRENETRMDALGYNVWLYKYVAFILAALFAGVAGGLFAYHNRFVSITVLGIIPAAQAFLMVILGGTGTLFGPALGAALIVVLENVISGYTDRWPLILGLIYIAVVMFAPSGVLVLGRHWWKRGFGAHGTAVAADGQRPVEELRRAQGRPASEPEP